MADITAKMVSDLRAQSGAGMMECKKALVEASGDLESAKDLLRKKGQAKVAKKADRSASEGLVGIYQHFDKKKVAIVELNCETDFVARNEKFQELANDLAMHVIAAGPRYLSRDDVPEEDIKREESVILESDDMKSKPEAARGKILEGRMRKFFEERCLLDQKFVKDETGARTVDQVLKEAIASLGENMKISRFARFEVGSA